MIPTRVNNNLPHDTWIQNIETSFTLQLHNPSITSKLQALSCLIAKHAAFMDPLKLIHHA